MHIEHRKKKENTRMDTEHNRFMRESLKQFLGDGLLNSKNKKKPLGLHLFLLKDALGRLIST